MFSKMETIDNRSSQKLQLLREAQSNPTSHIELGLREHPFFQSQQTGPDLFRGSGPYPCVQVMPLHHVVYNVIFYPSECYKCLHN